MIEIRKVQTTDGHRIDCFIPSKTPYVLEADAWMLFPALIDPAGESQEASQAIAGGITTLLCRSNHLEDQKSIPLRLHFYGESIPAIYLNHEISRDAFDWAAAHDTLIALPAGNSVEEAIRQAERTKAQLYLSNVYSKKDLDLIRHAKKKGITVFAEASPRHLFFERQDDLWDAIDDETIDTISSHLHYFPFLLNAYAQKKLSLEQIVSLTHTRPQEIFDLPINDDIVLVDMNRTRTVDGRALKGWPRYTICDGKLFDLEKL